MLLAEMKIAGIVIGAIAAIVLVVAGVDMMHIVSQSGDSIMEAFYHAMGKAFIGLAIFCLALVFIIGSRREPPVEESVEEDEEDKASDNTIY